MKILVISAFLVLLSACSGPCQRFVPVEQGVVLDTATGRYCNPYPKDVNHPTVLPFCEDFGKDQK